MSHPNPVISSILIAPTATANTLLVGDIINGMGIPVDSMVLNINSIGGGQWEILINQTPNSTDVYTIGNHGAYSNPNGANDGRVQWQTDLFITRDGKPFPFVNAPTLSFNEKVRGWVSFKSFAPENAISLTNEYYTFLNGKLFKHHVETVDRNTFYSEDSSIEDPFTPSSFNVLLNDVPGSIKSFSTLNYEGSQTKVDIDLDDDQYFNLTAKKGWYVESVETDQEKGDLNEFIEKEGKWFNYLKGQSVLTDVNNSVIINEDGSSSFDQSSFAIQGIGTYNLLPSGEDGDTIICDTCQDGYPVSNVFAGSVCPRDWIPTGNGNPCDISCDTCQDGYPVSNIFTGSNCPKGWIPTGSGNPCDVTCDSCWSGYPISQIFNGGSCPDGWIPSGTSINPCEENTIICDACNNGSPVSNIFSGDSCPKGWVPTGTLGPCEESGNTVVCDSCQDGVPVSTLYDGSVCPEGSIPTGSGNPCGASGSTVVCDTCQDGYTVSQIFDGSVCPEGSIPTGSGNPCGSVPPPLWVCGAITETGANNCTEVLPSDSMYSNLIIGNNAWESEYQCNGFCQVYGCTDPTALNYYAGANIDDGSCVFPVYGCMNPLAVNYDPNATIDNGSCAGISSDPCALIIASLNATINTQAVNAFRNGSAEVIFVDPANILPSGSSVAYNWFEGTVADNVTPDGSMTDGVHINDPNWGIFGQYRIGELQTGNYHVSVDTGDGCWRWFDFTIFNNAL